MNFIVSRIDSRNSEVHNEKQVFLQYDFLFTVCQISGLSNLSKREGIAHLFCVEDDSLLIKMN